MELVTVDIGGTHARFAIATVGAEGGVTLGETVTLRTADHATFASAWHAYARGHSGKLPRAAAFSIAAPVSGEVIHLVNNPWVIDRAALAGEIGGDRVLILNDFGAVGHAVANLPADCFAHVAGPDAQLPAEGTISVLGPGTGLGVAHVWRDGRPTSQGGGYHVQATEGGHFSFAPIDPVDDALLAHLRARFGRVSVERVVAGPGIVDIHAVLAAQQGLSVTPCDDKTIWERGIAGSDALAAAAVERFCRQLGAVAGDVTLTQGGTACVLAGGIGLRLRDLLPRSGFGRYFAAKGRFSEIMAAMPVKLITHPQPGLFGAAAAFAREHHA
jgi:glucokinase